MDKNSLVGPFLSHSPSRVYRGDGAIRFSGEARYKYLHVDILYFLLGLHAQSFKVEVGELDDAISVEVFRQIGKRDCPVIIYGVLSGIECAVEHGPDDIQG